MVHPFRLAPAERLRQGAVVAAALAAVVFFALFNPEKALHWLQCPFHAVTGFYCPGCGSCRALHQLLQGHLFTALRCNHLLVVCAPFLGYALASRASMAVRGKGLPSFVVPALWIQLLAVYLVVYWIVRNIPSYPFTLLAPG